MDRHLPGRIRSSTGEKSIQHPFSRDIPRDGEFAYIYLIIPSFFLSQEPLTQRFIFSKTPAVLSIEITPKSGKAIKTIFFHRLILLNSSSAKTAPTLEWINIFPDESDPQLGKSQFTVPPAATPTPSAK
ncbi:hypothetical protein CDAR_541421 [Caerostris darwini]|uniref:Uncharacterized protein n=1 Tax=Caerostris darwini TaxID=1538125 RepID=A0AAV4VUW5_9ARAC|nr:hypothetical protein CDAR_541421 [Caerostris darwini]